MMNEARQELNMPLVAKMIRAYLRTNLRGRTRLTFSLSQQLKSLQAVPITIAGGAPFYVDLRAGQSHELLKGTPWKSAPWEIDEQSIMRLVVSRGDNVFDIGANIGMHAVLLAELIAPEGKLCIFEPNAELLPTLSRTVGGLSNAALYPIALSNESREATLFVPEDHSMASLADWTKGRAEIGEAHVLTCKVRRLDDLIANGTLPQPDFIKCDVEGAELMVFQGGEQMLNLIAAPIILFEANVHNARGFSLQSSAAKDFLANLAQPRYQFFEIQSGAIGRLEQMDPVHSNILAIPQAKISKWPELAAAGHLQLS